MKILIATGIFPPDIGGPATYSKLLVDELPKQGVGVEVLSYGAVRHLPKGLSHLVYFLKLVKAARQADFIYAQDTLSVGLPTALASKILGKKFVLRVPGDYVWEQSVQRFGLKENIDEFQNKKYSFKIEGLRKLQRLTASLADLIVAPSAYFQKLVGSWVKNPAKVKLIYNGIKLGEVRGTPWSNREKILVSAGRLVPWKGFAFLIDLMRDLPDFKLELYGSGPEDRRLNEKIQALGLADRVFLKGQVAREKLLAVLSQSFAFILNSSFESFSFQVVEAMNAGAPVIAARAGNLSEIIKTGEEGFLVELNNKAAFLEALNKLNQNEALAQDLIARAKIKAQNFSLTSSLDLLMVNLRELIQS